MVTLWRETVDWVSRLSACQMSQNHHCPTEFKRFVPWRCSMPKASHVFFAQLFAFAPGSISWEISMPAVPYPPAPQNEQVLCVKRGDEMMWRSLWNRPRRNPQHPPPLLPNMAKATFKGTKSSRTFCANRPVAPPRCSLPCACIQIGSNCSHFSLSLFESAERVLMCTKDSPPWPARHPPKMHCLSTWKPVILP